MQWKMISSKYIENILKQIFQLELNDKTNLTKKKNAPVNGLTGPAGVWLATFTSANKIDCNATHLERKSELCSTGTMRKTT